MKDGTTYKAHCRLAAAMAGACAALSLFGGEIRTEKLADDIWRVRMSRDGKWTESALNRYGIISNLQAVATGSSLDFGVVKPEAKQVGKGFELRFPLAKDDRVYGLGDVSRKSLNRRGDAYEMWVKNVYSYIPVPMMMTSSGWGVLVNTTYRHTFDVGKSDPDAVVVTAKEGDVDFYVFKGRDYRAMLDAYTRLTGRPALLPAFAYGFAYVANQHIDSYGLTNEAFEFRRQKLPCDIIGLEPGWMEYHYDFTTKKSWNKGRFSFPYWIKPSDHRRSWIGALEEMDFKLSLWLCINYDVLWFEEQCAAGLARPTAKRSDIQSDRESEVFFDKHIEGDFSDQKQGDMDAAMLRAEVANARRQSVCRPDKMMGKDQDASKDPWFEHLKKFVDRGARCFKLDASQQVHEFPGRVYAGKLSHDEAHNMFSVVYDKQMAEGYEVYTGKRAMVYSPAGYTGLQRYVATWAGDTGGGRGPLVSALNLGMTGHPNQSCDMNTFDIAAVHFGVFAPWSQQNNWDYYHQIWFRAEEKTNAIREYLNLRYRLFPYLYATAAESSRTGWPIMRPLAFEYPSEPAYANETGTYLLGDSLLVAAFSDEVKVPSGTWYEWRTGEKVFGPTTLPVRKTDTWGGATYVKAGAIIPMWPLKQHIERGWNDKVEFHVYLGGDGEFSWYEDDGDSLAYRSGASATARVSLKGGVLTIGAREGSFDGMPEAHDITVVWHSGGRTETTELGVVKADVQTVVPSPKDRMEPSLKDVIAKTCPIVKTDVWQGGRRTVFTFRGHEAWVVEPPPGVAPAEGRPWTWTMQWATAFVPRTGVPRLLKAGWHHVTLMQFDERMTEEGIALSEAFQDFLVKELGFAPKANLIGMSWGGFFSVRYAAARPDRIDRIYLDAPLLSFEGFTHDSGPWKATEPAGGWRDDPRMPVNMAGALAKAGMPILLLYGKADAVVPPALNCERFVDAYKAAGGKNIKTCARAAFGHHPHGCDVDDTTISDFFRGLRNP